MDWRPQVINLQPRSIATGKVRYLVHERDTRFPGNAKYPSFAYAWFSENKSFWSIVQDPFAPPLHSDAYIVRYIYTLKRPIRMIHVWDDEAYLLREWIDRIYPGQLWSDEDWIDYPEAAFLLQVLGYDGIYFDEGDQVILSDRIYDDLSIYAILEFNVENERPIIEAYTQEVPTGRGVEQDLSQMKVFYHEDEIAQLRQQLSQYIQ